MNNQKRHGGGSVLGFLLIVVGALWLLDNIGTITFSVSQWWPLIIIAVGLGDLANSRRVNNFSGWFLIVLGLVFLLPTTGLVGWNEIWKFWPAALILVGFSLILKRDTCCAPGRTSETSGEDQIKGHTVFGDLEKVLNSQAFSGGTLSTVFGDTRLNLREAKLGHNGAVIDASVIFGDITIMIPQSWPLEIRSSTVLGSLKNNCRNSQVSEGQRLIINAHVVFGDLKITN